MGSKKRVVWLLGTDARSAEGEERVKAYCSLHGMRFVGTEPGEAEALEGLRWKANGAVLINLSSLGNTASEICAFADQAFSSGMDIMLAEGPMDSTAHGRLLFNTLQVLGRWERERRVELATFGSEAP